MMASTTKRQPRYPAGEKGRNRVTAFPDPKTGAMQLEWRENGRRRQRSLKHRDWKKAKQQADQLAARLALRKSPEPESSGPLTVGRLFEMYQSEVTPSKGERSQKHDRVTLAMFEGFLGSDRDPMTLSKRDWDRFIHKRSRGDIGPSRRAVGPRTVERDLRLLLAVLNWAERSRDDRGVPLLDRNPLRGLKTPKEKNPRRVVLTNSEYQALCKVADEVGWRFQVALVLAYETGHRIGAIRKLRWSDIDLDGASIRWRAENEKNGYEHVTPITPEAVAILEFARQQNPGIGEAPVFPAPKDPLKPGSKELFRDYWKRAEKLAGLDRKTGRGWHAARRQFGSEMMHLPLKLVCQLGGWKSPSTVLECYQHADQDMMKAGLQERRRA